MLSKSFKFIILLFSRIWIALIGIFFIPIYVKILGVESYGLVAFYSTLAGSLSILDLGLSTAISRQVSILQTQEDKDKDIKDLIFSVEIIYWLIALFVGVLILLTAQPIALYWVKAKELPIAVIQKSVMLMGGIFAIQFPASIYSGILIGANKQVTNSVTTVLFATLKAVGVIGVLKFANPTIENYLVWQLLITLISTFCFRFLVWQNFPTSIIKADFSIQQLQTIWRFAAGMAGISIITFFLSQIDKVVVSKIVLLEFVGYYNLAFMVSNGITQVISPIQPIIFPKFSALVAENKQVELVELYHKISKWVAILVFPVGFILIFFGKEILLIWTKNQILTDNTTPILRVFAAGTICNSLMWVPYFYMLSKGITKFTIYQNAIASIILVPLLFVWTSKYGIIGASFVWLVVNASYVFITIPIFHQLYLKGELWKWYKNAFFPLLYSLLILFFLKFFQPYILTNLDIFNLIKLLSIVLILYSALIPEIRIFFYNATKNIILIYKSKNRK